MTPLDVHHQAGPIAVTLVYLLFYYALQLYQMRVENRLFREYADRGEEFDRYFGQDREMLAADRMQLNTLEHMPAFLVLLWTNAVFVGPRATAIAGCVYVIARILYPIFLGQRVGRQAPARIVVATYLGYWC